MLYDVTHRTRFRYGQPVRFARCNLRLEPIAWDGQELEGYALEVTPQAMLTPGRNQGYPVNLIRMLLEEPASEVVIESRFRMRVDRLVPLAMPDDPTVAEVAALARESRDLSATGPASYLSASPMIALDPDIGAWCADLLAPDQGIVAACMALSARINAEFRYDGSATHAATLPREAFLARHGVCQDFAQIMIAGLRANGIAAAYVSGYLRTIPPPGQARLVGADATHAWALVWCGPVRGWIGFDPTNAIAMAGDHLVTAIGRDFSDVSPIDGVFLGQGTQALEVTVDVEPVEDD
jgi:transglutaminase-like putative cysteine protease